MSEYCFWMRADYFCKHLLGDSQTSADILPLDREQPQTGDKRVRTLDMPEEDEQSEGAAPHPGPALF